MTYNVNVRHTKSLVLNIVVSHAVYESLFDEVHSGVHCSCRSVTLFRIYTEKFSKQLTYFSVAPIMTLSKPWGNKNGMPFENLKTENLLVQLICLNIERFISYHIAEMLAVHLGRIFFLKNCEKFAVLVTKMFT